MDSNLFKINFDLSYRHFINVCLSISRLRLHAFTDCHKIFNQRTMYKGRATYVYGFFFTSRFRIVLVLMVYPASSAGVERGLLFTEQLVSLVSV